MSEDDIRDMDKQIAKEAENEPDDEQEEPEEDANNNPQDSKVVNG